MKIIVKYAGYYWGPERSLRVISVLASCNGHINPCYGQMGLKDRIYCANLVLGPLWSKLLRSLKNRSDAGPKWMEFGKGDIDPAPIQSNSRPAQKNRSTWYRKLCINYQHCTVCSHECTAYRYSVNIGSFNNLFKTYHSTYYLTGTFIVGVVMFVNINNQSV